MFLFFSMFSASIFLRASLLFLFNRRGFLLGQLLLEFLNLGLADLFAGLGLGERGVYNFIVC